MPEAGQAATSQRIDQWLWFARIVKSRTLAQALIERGKVRLNRERLDKSSQPVKAGDVLTLTLGPHVRVIHIKAIGHRRGPAPEAALLYTEPDAVAPRSDRGATGSGKDASASAPPPSVESRPKGAGRPTKRDRRAIDRLKRSDE